MHGGPWTLSEAVAPAVVVIEFCCSVVHVSVLEIFKSEVSVAKNSEPDIETSSENICKLVDEISVAFVVVFVYVISQWKILAACDGAP